METSDHLFKNTTRHALLHHYQKWSKMLHTEHPLTYYFSTFISNKFPRLLAEREIIANALC